MEQVAVIIKMPPHLKQAAEAEAQRRGVSVSALVKNYLSSFLPVDIGKPIHANKAEVRP